VVASRYVGLAVTLAIGLALLGLASMAPAQSAQDDDRASPGD
jgi:hypothetical protein